MHRVVPKESEQLADPYRAMGVHGTPGKFIFLCIITEFHHVCTRKQTFLSVVAPCVHHGPLYSSSAADQNRKIYMSHGKVLHKDDLYHVAGRLRKIQK
jgi:hypothetical protein